MYRTDSLTAAGKASYELHSMKAAVNPFLVDEYSETILHRIGKYTKVIMSNAFNMFERVTSLSS